MIHPACSSTEVLDQTCSGDVDSVRQTFVAHLQCFAPLLSKHLCNLPTLSATFDGRYSLGKLAAFDRFRKKATIRWIIVLLIFSPVPAILLILALECIPLADPKLGWKHSMAFQLRITGMFFIMGFLSLYARHEHLKETAINWKRALVLGSTLATAFMATSFTIMATTDVFPVPLVLIVSLTPLSIAAHLIFAVVDKIRVFPPDIDISEYKRKIKTIDRLQMVQALPLIIYPVYAAVFSHLEASIQPWFALVLVALRYSIRYVQWYAARNDVDLANTVMGTTGHLFHVLFTLTCLQNAKSTSTLRIILVFNTIQMIRNCHILTQGFTKAPDIHSLTMAIQLLENDATIKELDRADRKLVLSTYHRYHDSRLLRLHDSAHIRVLRIKTRKKPCINCVCRPVDSILSTPGPMYTEETLFHSQNHCEHLTMVTKVCTALHESEAILLRLYVTLIVVTMYAAYLVAVFWLPNRQYILTMQTMTTFASVRETIIRLSAIFLTEMAFGCIYLTLIYRRLGVLGTTLVAFVLSSQFKLFQVKFISYPLFIFAFPLVHSETDVIQLNACCRVNATAAVYEVIGMKKT